MSKTELLEKIEARYLPEPNTGCWLWTGSLNGNGYGELRIDGRQRKAHRLTWELYRGPIKPGLDVDHLCRVPCCVNPDHLEPVTRRENIMRGLNGVLRTPQTHCLNGHAFTVENTLFTPEGRRRCRRCCALRQRKYRAVARATGQAGEG